MKIFVVEGSIEDPDYRGWLVMAYRTEAAAREKAIRCAERARLLLRHSGSEDRWADEYSSIFKNWKYSDIILRNEDPNIRNNYEDTNYRIIEVELEDK